MLKNKKGSFAFARSLLKYEKALNEPDFSCLKQSDDKCKSKLTQDSPWDVSFKTSKAVIVLLLLIWV